MFGASKTASGSNLGPSDPYYEYVTMLLTGDGTNGAQNNTFLDSSTNAFSITRNGNPTQGSDRKSTRLNSSHIPLSRMPSSA